MIYGKDYEGLPGYIEEYQSSTAEVAAAGFNEAMSDNPFTKALD